MGRYLYLCDHQRDLGGFTVSDTVWLALHWQIATVCGFHYTMPHVPLLNPAFDPAQPEDDFYNSRWIPDVTHGLQLVMPAKSPLTLPQLKQLQAFILATGMRGEIKRSQIGTLLTVFEHLKTPQLKANNWFQALLTKAQQEHCYLKWI